MRFRGSCLSALEPSDDGGQLSKLSPPHTESHIYRLLVVYPAGNRYGMWNIKSLKGELSMNKRKILKTNFLMAGIMLLVLLAFLTPRAHAQFVPFGPFGPFYSPVYGFGPFGYIPFLPPAPPSFGAGPYRRANVPLTASTLFPAPVLPIAPVATIGGVGISTLIPTVPVTATVPATALLTTPLAPLITFTPLSLIGLTFAPVATAPATVAVPLTAIAAIPTIIPTVPTATAVSFASLISSLLI